MTYEPPQSNYPVPATRHSAPVQPIYERQVATYPTTQAMPVPVAKAFRFDGGAGTYFGTALAAAVIIIW